MPNVPSALCLWNSNNYLLRLGSRSLDRACMRSGSRDVTCPSFVSQYDLFPGLNLNFMICNSSPVHGTIISLTSLRTMEMEF